MNNTKFVLIILAIIGLAVAIFLCGCLPQQSSIDTGTLTEETKSDVLKHKDDLVHIFAANKLATFLFLAIAVGGFMITQGLAKTGLGLIFGAGLGLWAIKTDQTIATKYPWLYLVVGAVAIAGTGFYLLRTYKKNRATTQVVGSVQKYFGNKGGGDGTRLWEDFKKYVKREKAQSKSTQKIVKNIKAKNNF